MTARLIIAACALVAACGHPPEPAPAPPRGAAPAAAAAPIDASDAPEPERLAAIQKAMNDLAAPAQQCWAAAATERFDIEGELVLQIDIAAGSAQATAVRDTTRNRSLADCVVRLLGGYRWAPPLHGQTIQLPFQFRAPDGQNTIDRTLVGWRGQAKLSVAVLLDETNTGSDAASMLELAIAPGGTTGMRIATRAELWYFLAPGEVAQVAGAPRAVAAGDMMYAARGSAREVRATAGELRAMIAIVPGGREGAARGGALPTPELTAVLSAPVGPRILPAAAAKTYGPATIYADATLLPDKTLAASVLSLAAGATVAEHEHAGEAELLYVLAGAGTMTVAGVALPVVATSVVQIPRHTRHSFTATAAVRAVQIYTPAGPEQRFKAHP